MLDQFKTLICQKPSIFSVEFILFLFRGWTGARRCCARARVTPRTWSEGGRGKARAFLGHFCWCSEAALSHGQDAAAWGQIQGFAHPWMLKCKDNTTSELVSGKPAFPLEIMVSQAISDLPCTRPLSQKSCRGFPTPPCEGALNHSQQFSQTSH